MQVLIDHIIFFISSFKPAFFRNLIYEFFPLPLLLPEFDVIINVKIVTNLGL